MNIDQVCKISLLVTSPPGKRSYEYTDNRGIKRKNEKPVLRGTLIPSDPNATQASLKKAEFSITEASDSGAKKNTVDITMLYAKHQDKLDNGEAYMVAEVFMGPNINRQSGMVTMYIPTINDVEVLFPTNETEAAQIKAAMVDQDLY